MDPPIIGPESLTALEVLSATYRLDRRKASLRRLQISESQVSRCLANIEHV